MFGAGAMTNSIPEIREADLIFVIGSNTTEAHPIIAMEMKRAVGRGATLIVADPRKIWLAEVADIHLQLKAGTDVALLNALAHVIIKEGLTDDAFIEEHTENFEAVRGAVAECTPEFAESLTGVPADDIRATARAYATTKKAGIYYTLGITEHTHGTDNVYGLANLVLMTGHLGVKSAGLNPLRGQNNVQGTNDAGASPIYYPGYQRVDDQAVQRKFEAAWGVDLSPTPGLTLNAMMESLAEGELRGLYVMGEDIIMSEPNATKVERGIKNCEFLVVQEILPNETSRYADVILPAACFAEKDGVFTNSDRRVQRVRKAVDPPGEARPDWKILCEMAIAVGYQMPAYSSPKDVYAEMASLAPKFSGISWDRIEREGGLQWPCPDSAHPGTPTLHQGAPIAGTATFMAISYRPSAELPDPEYPLLLSTGRTLYHYNSGTQTRKAAGPVAKQGENFLQMHRYDAGKLGISDGDSVEVSSRRGSVMAVARVAKKVQPGMVWMPFHFSENPANHLTNDAGDSVTGTGEYKVCAVRVVSRR